MNLRTRQLVNTLAEMVQPQLQKQLAPERPINKIPGFSVRMTSADTAEIMIYGTIGGGFWPQGVTAADIAEQLNELSAAITNVHVRINSGGGSVFEGVAIHAQLRRHAATVTTFVDGLAASAASFIAMAGDRVVMARGSMMMIHDGSTFTEGNEADHLEAAALLGKVSDVIADLYAARAGEDTATWRERMRAETWYTAAEAVDAGLADEMTDPDEDDEDEATDRVRTVLSSSGKRFRNAPKLPDTPARKSKSVEPANVDGDPAEDTIVDDAVEQLRRGMAALLLSA